MPKSIQIIEDVSIDFVQINQRIAYETAVTNCQWLIVNFQWLMGRVGCFDSNALFSGVLKSWVYDGDLGMGEKRPLCLQFGAGKWGVARR